MDTAYSFSAESFISESPAPAPRILEGRAFQRKVSPLRALMDFYESGDDLDGEESEVDLMIQLSGMVGGSTMALDIG